MLYFAYPNMINDKIIGKSSLSGRNYLLVDLERLQKEELAQRRKLRIQQVRLQSKDLASRVLQDVRNERKLHIKGIQNKQTDVFKKLQSRKLHEINLKYKENINTGQRAASELPDPNEEIKQQIKKNTEIAQERGRKAITQLRTVKEISRSQQEKFALHREKAKTLESIRSAMVSSLSYANTKRNPDHKSLDTGGRAFCSQALETKSSGPEVRDNVAPGKEMNEEELDEEPTSAAIPGLCLEETPTERRFRKDPISSSKKSVSVMKAPPLSVEVYDHHNPCAISQRQPPTVRVERTSLNSQTNAREAAEMEMKEEAERQASGIGAEDDARIKRGKKALAKELVRRDFDRLMTRMSGLAREERLARVTELPKLPPEIYMNEERTAMKIRKQQQDLESAFEGVLHGNKGISIRKDPLQSREDDDQVPLVVEQAIFPEKWKINWKVREVEPSLQKVNVGVCDRASSSSGYQAETSFSGANSSVHAGDSELNVMKNANQLVKSAPSEKVTEEKTNQSQSEERENIELHDAQEELEKRIKTARLLLEGKEDEDTSIDPAQKLVDECSQDPKNQSSRGNAAWWCSFTSGRGETHNAPPALIVEEKEDLQDISDTKRKIAVCKHSFELKGKTFEELDLHVRKGKKHGVNLDTNESLSSTTSSSWRLEEVQVVLKVDDLSSEREVLGKEDRSSPGPGVISKNTSGHMKPQRERKKRKVEEKQEAKPKELGAKVILRQKKPLLKFPDEREPRERKEKLDVASQGTQVGKDMNLKADKKRRERKDGKKQRLGLQPPLSESSYLSPPSHQDLSDTDQAKVLLEEIRSQRRRLEEWVGLKEHDNGKVNAQLGAYIQRLLSMTRESVAELSVSEVSSPVLRHSTPVTSGDSSLLEVAEVPLSQKKFEDKAVGTSFNDTIESQEAVVKVTPVLDQKKMAKSPQNEDVPDLGVSKSLVGVKLRSKSPQFSPSILPRELPSPMVAMPEQRFKPPSPPPPSPEYEELSVLHSQRISQLGAKLTEIREIKKRLLTPLHSSGSESKSSPSSSTISSRGESSSSIGMSDSSKKSDGSFSSETNGLRKSWDLLLEEHNGSGSPKPEHVTAVDDQDSEDSLLEQLLLESLHVSEPKKSFKPSEEIKASQKYDTAKAGPPPTAMKGGIWIGSGFQIPHELSTIVEVDSRMLSTTSLAEPRKEKDLTTAVVGTQQQLEPLGDALKASEVIQPKRVGSPPMKIDGDMDTSSNWLKKIENLFLEAKNILPDSTAGTNACQREDEENSDASLPVSVASFADSNGFPEDLDAALRLLGISPSVLQGRKSPASKEVSPVSSHQSSSSQASLRITHSHPASPLKDEVGALPTFDAESRATLRDLEVEEQAGDFEQQKSWLQFTPLGSFKDLSLGSCGSKSLGVDKSVGKGKRIEEVGGSEQLNFQSTPIGSLRDFTFGSGSSSISEPRSKVKDGIVRGAFRSVGVNLVEIEPSPLREKSSPELGKSDKSDRGSPIIPKETPQYILKHSTPFHSFSGEGSSSSNSEERKKSLTCFPFVGDSAPSSISGGNGSGGGMDWRHLGDENESVAHSGVKD